MGEYNNCVGGGGYREGEVATARGEVATLASAAPPTQSCIISIPARCHPS